MTGDELVWNTTAPDADQALADLAAHARDIGLDTTQETPS